MLFNIGGKEVYFTANLTVRKNSPITVELEGSFGDFMLTIGLLQIKPLLIQRQRIRLFIQLLFHTVELIYHPVNSTTDVG